MRLLRSRLVRLFGLFSRRRSDAEFAAELESHLQLHIDEGIRAGLTPAEARRAALLKLGPVEALRESYRDQSLIPGIAGAARDVRFGFRMLRRQPGFALTAIATLALGIGVNTAIFSIVDAVLLRPLPYSRPERIVEITGGGQGFVRFGPVLDVSPRTLKESPAFSSMGLYVAGAVNLGGDAAERVAAAAVTPGFFDVLGVKPALGRTFSDEDIAASGRIAVISDRLWRGRLRRDPGIVGRPLTLDGASFTVVGVMPPGVAFPAGALLWVPTNGTTGVLGQVAIAKVIARLNEGVAAASARDRVLGATALKGQAAAAVQVAPLREALVGAVRPIALAVWIAAGLVLLVACINAANLLLARVARRQREFAVRRALGATRGRLIRQVVLESLVLSALGALASIPAAIWTLQAARVLLPATLHGVADLGIDGRTIFAAGGLALVATLLFGLGPSLSIRPLSSADAVHAAAPGRDRFWRRVRSGLLVAEIAIALVLLAGATALVQEIREVMAIDIGVRGERALAIELSLPRATYRTVDDHRAFFARADDVLRAVPGVEEVGVTSQLPGRAPALLVVQHVAIEGHAPAAAERHEALLLTASPGYFAAAGIDLIAGRALTKGDRPGTESVVIVSESFARLLGLQPAQLIGARVPSQDAAATIVGVVRDVRLHGPERPFAPALYVPHVVNPRTYGPVYLVIRAAADPVALVPAIRSAVARIDADLPLYNIRSFDEIRAALLTERRLAMITMVVFAGLAFVLSAIGLYGVVSYLVQARTREIGIRLAIGASRPAVCRGVLWSGAGHALAGVGLGIAASLAVTTLVASRLPALGRVSFESVAWLAVMLVAVALLATVIPAWRASRIDPAVTLRAE